MPPPPFATLGIVQNARGAYTRDATISLAITPSLPVLLKHNLIVGGGWGLSVRHRRARGREMLLTLQVGYRASALRGKEAELLREVTGVSIVDAGIRIRMQ